MVLNTIILQFFWWLSFSIKVIVPVAGSSKSVEPFSCAGKVIGGYYADVAQSCQMFHVCTIGEKGEIRDIVFRCLNGTVFDQETRVCEREEEVDCMMSTSFFYLNNELYGPGIIPDTGNGLRRNPGLTYGQKFSDQLTPTTTHSHSECSGNKHAILYAHPSSQCKLFHMCIPQPFVSDLRFSFVCADDNHVFDVRTGLCEHKLSSSCDKQMAPFEVTIRDAEISAVHTIGICSFLKKGSSVIDSRTNCQQYLECPTNTRSPVSVRRCPKGTLFSQLHQKCIISSNVSCSEDVYSLFKMVDVKVMNFKERDFKNWRHFNELESRVPLFVRYKRGLTLQHKDSRTEEQSAGENGDIFSKQTSIVDSRGNGNVVKSKDVKNIDSHSPVVNERVRNPTSEQIERILKTSRMSHSLQPETFLEFNKTTLNGTVIEVSEIASPDNKGKVTITSVVPKIVNQNGNGGHQNQQNQPIPTAISNGGTKITLLGSNAPDPFKTTQPKEEFENITALNEFENVTGVNITDGEYSTTEPFLSEYENSTLFGDDSIDIASTTLATDIESGVTETTEYGTTEVLSTTTSIPTTSTTSKSTVDKESAVSIEPETGRPVTDGSVQSNFTCKDKELEQFYPDIENDCRLFHYCSPGFTEAEVLDLTFVCSGETRFDIRTKKCQEKSTVVCGDRDNEAKSDLSSTTAIPTTSTSTTTTTSTTSTTTTSTTTITTTTTPSTTEETTSSSTASTTPYVTIPISTPISSSESNTNPSAMTSPGTSDLPSTPFNNETETPSHATEEVTVPTMEKTSTDNQITMNITEATITEINRTETLLRNEKLQMEPEKIADAEKVASLVSDISDSEDINGELKLELIDNMSTVSNLENSTLSTVEVPITINTTSFIDSIQNNTDTTPVTVDQKMNETTMVSIQEESDFSQSERSETEQSDHTKVATDSTTTMTSTPTSASTSSSTHTIDPTYNDSSTSEDPTHPPTEVVTSAIEQETPTANIQSTSAQTSIDRNDSTTTGLK